MSALNFTFNNFSYEFFLSNQKDLNNPNVHEEQLNIKIEHTDDKRVWTTLIDDKICESGKIGDLTPVILYDIFKNEKNNINQFISLTSHKIDDFFSVEFPEQAKDDQESLLIKITQHSPFPSLCKEYILTLLDVNIPLTERLQKQIKDVKNINNKQDNLIIDMQKQIKELQNKFMKIKLESEFNDKYSDIVGVQTRSMRKKKLNNSNSSE
jgi:hypothetical protein